MRRKGKVCNNRWKGGGGREIEMNETNGVKKKEIGEGQAGS
jgi:hypothetical protein